MSPRATTNRIDPGKWYRVVDFIAVDDMMSYDLDGLAEREYRRRSGWWYRVHPKAEEAYRAAVAAKRLLGEPTVNQRRAALGLPDLRLDYPER